MDQMPNINGVVYSWGQLAIRALGLIFTGVSAIKYDDKQEMEKIYGAGNMPVGIGIGKYDATGSITLHMEELENIQNAAPGKRIQKIPPFDVTITYLREDGITVFHTLKNCKFMNNGRDVKQGDMKIEKEIELLYTHIDW